MTGKLNITFLRAVFKTFELFDSYRLRIWKDRQFLHLHRAFAKITESKAIFLHEFSGEIAHHVLYNSEAEVPSTFCENVKDSRRM